MSNLIRVEVDTSELEAKLEDLEALESRIEELTTSVQVLEDELGCQREEAQQASLEGDNTEGADMLSKFMTQDEIEEFIKEILRDAPISIDV